LPTSNSISQAKISDEQAIEYLKVEVEHFYRAELQSEQRASWLLTLVFGALALVLNCFVNINEHKMRGETAPYFAVCAFFFFVTLIF
jgi:hypothetical protein